MKLINYYYNQIICILYSMKFIIEKYQQISSITHTVAQMEYI